MTDSPQNRPAASHSWVFRLAWMVAVVALVLAAFLAAKVVALTTTARIDRTELEFVQAEKQSLHQQLEAERILAHREIARSRMETGEAPPALLKLSPPSGAPPATAFIAWPPQGQQGRMITEGLPPLATGKEYRLWLVDAQGVATPVCPLPPLPSAADGFVFPTAGQTSAVARVVVSLEDAGAPATSPGLVVLTSTPR